MVIRKFVASVEFVGETPNQMVADSFPLEHHTFRLMTYWTLEFDQGRKEATAMAQYPMATAARIVRSLLSNF